MKIDTALGFGLAGAERSARAAEAAGFDGLWATEVRHDPFCPLVMAAEHTARVELGTAPALAFARDPMVTATLANDLQAYSHGRFILGLGVPSDRAGDRFSTPSSEPAARLRELILAVRAIWASWATDQPVEFNGEFFRHRSDDAFAQPGPNPFGNPRIFVAGAGSAVAEVAGEVADGFLCQQFMTERYFRHVTLPALRRGRTAAGKAMDGFEISGLFLLVTGRSDRDLDRATGSARQRLAFEAARPAHRDVLEEEGWDEIHLRLRALDDGGRWAEMARCINDEILHSVAILGTPESVAPALHARYGHAVTRIALSPVYSADPDRWRDLIDAIRGVAQLHPATSI